MSEKLTASDLRRIFDPTRRGKEYAEWLAQQSQGAPDPEPQDQIWHPPAVNAPSRLPPLEPERDHYGRELSPIVDAVTTPVAVLKDVECIVAHLEQVCSGCTFSLTPQLLMANYFQPLAVANTVTESNNPDKTSRLLLHKIEINCCPQESWSSWNAGGGVWTDAYYAPAGYAVPVGWGVFSQANLIHTLMIEGTSPHPPGSQTHDYRMVIYGNSMQSPQPGMPVGATPRKRYPDY